MDDEEESAWSSLHIKSTLSPEPSLCTSSWFSQSFLGSIGAVRDLNTFCNLNLFWATYHRLLLLSSLFCLSSLTSPPLCCPFSLIFSFNDETEGRRRRRAAFLLPVNYPPVRLSVRLNWRSGRRRPSSQRARPEQWRPV